MEVASLAGRIDFTCLDPYASLGDLKRFCEEATGCGARTPTICVFPSDVETCVRSIDNSGAKVHVVIGYPFGMYGLGDLRESVRSSLVSGAKGVDLFLNVATMNRGSSVPSLEAVIPHIALVRDIVSRDGEKLNVIMNIDRFSERTILEVFGGVTDIGVGSVGIFSLENKAMLSGFLSLIKKLRHVSEKLEIKVCDVEDWETALWILDAGATRIGSSHGMKILKRVQERDED